MIHEQDAIVLAAVLSDQVRKGPKNVHFESTPLKK